MDSEKVKTEITESESNQSPPSSQEKPTTKWHLVKTQDCKPLQQLMKIRQNSNLDNSKLIPENLEEMDQTKEHKIDNSNLENSELIPKDSDGTSQTKDQTVDSQTHHIIDIPEEQTNEDVSEQQKTKIEDSKILENFIRKLETGSPTWTSHQNSDEDTKNEGQVNLKTKVEKEDFNRDITNENTTRNETSIETDLDKKVEQKLHVSFEDLKINETESLPKYLPKYKQRCYITDHTPHIIQTTLGYHVLAQMNYDRSLFIYKTNGEIIKAAPWYRNSTLDINKILSTQWTHGSRYNDWETNLKLLSPQDKEALREEIGKLQLQLPEQKVELENIDREDFELTFTNFALPSRQTLQCWFHPSNIWINHYPDVYKCYGYDIEIPIQGKYTRNGPVAICTPIEIFFNKFDTTKISYDVYLDKKPALDEVLQLIKVFEIAQNNPKYRCRLDIEDKDSSFWVDKPLMKRIVDCLTYPNSKITLDDQKLIDLSELMESQKQHTSITYNEVYNGLGLLDNIMDDNQKKIELTSHFLRSLIWTELEDEEARKRGYYYVSHSQKYTFYKNIFRFDLYTVRSDECGFEYHVFHNGTTPAYCKPNHDPIETGNKPLNQPIFFKSKVYDITPKSLNSDTIDEWVDLDIETLQKNHFQSTNLANDWIPATIQCCAKCPIPYCANYQFDRYSKKFRRMRKIEIPNEVLDKCSWIPVTLNSYDDQVFDGEWKYTKIDKIPIFKCFNSNPKHENIEDEQMSNTTTIITYSVTRGLSGLNPDHFELQEDPKRLDERENVTTWVPPATPCTPGCHIPTELLDLNLNFVNGFTDWYKQFSLNLHILNHKAWKTINFPCTATYTKSWEMIIFKGKPVFRCQNSFTSIPMILPITSDKRWTIAYCFAEDQFRQIKWRPNPNGQGYTCRIHKARIHIPDLQTQTYTVTLDSGLSCCYEFKMDKVGQPVTGLQWTEPPYEQDADVEVMTHCMINPDNFGLTEEFLRNSQHFNVKDAAEEYSLSMKILEQLRYTQSMNESTSKIISMIPSVAIPPKHPKFRFYELKDEDENPCSNFGADRPTANSTRKEKRRKRKAT